MTVEAYGGEVVSLRFLNMKESFDTPKRGHLVLACFIFFFGFEGTRLQSEAGKSIFITD